MIKNSSTPTLLPVLKLDEQGEAEKKKSNDLDRSFSISETGNIAEIGGFDSVEEESEEECTPIWAARTQRKRLAQMVLSHEYCVIRMTSILLFRFGEVITPGGTR